MSAPPLPEAFGNYALGDFVEVVSPTAVNWWPQTAGWGWLAAALSGLACYHLWRFLRHWYHNRYRREAATRLQGLAAARTPLRVSELNRLLKLTALAAFAREQVAQLSGEDWVAFLNQHCPAAPFSEDQGRLLALAAYTGEPVETGAAQQLLLASLAWVREHENPRDA